MGNYPETPKQKKSKKKLGGIICSELAPCRVHQPPWHMPVPIPAAATHCLIRMYINSIANGIALTASNATADVTLTAGQGASGNML